MCHSRWARVPLALIQRPLTAWLIHATPQRIESNTFCGRPRRRDTLPLLARSSIAVPPFPVRPLLPREPCQLSIRQNAAAHSHALHSFRGQAGSTEWRGSGLYRAHARGIVRKQIFRTSHLPLPAKISSFKSTLQIILVVSGSVTFRRFYQSAPSALVFSLKAY
jgi:hypothetical protein